MEDHYLFYVRISRCRQVQNADGVDLSIVFTLLLSEDGRPRPALGRWTPIFGTDAFPLYDGGERCSGLGKGIPATHAANDNKMRSPSTSAIKEFFLSQLVTETTTTIFVAEERLENQFSVQLQRPPPPPPTFFGSPEKERALLVHTHGDQYGEIDTVVVDKAEQPRCFSIRIMIARDDAMRVHRKVSLIHLQARQRQRPNAFLSGLEDALTESLWWDIMEGLRR